MSKSTKKEILKLIKYQDELINEIELLKREFNNRMEELEIKNNTLKNDNEMLKNENKALEEKVKKSKSTNSEMDKELIKISDELKDLTKKNNYLQQHIELLKDELKECQKYYMNLIQDNNKLMNIKHEDVVYKTIKYIGYKAYDTKKEDSLLYVDKELTKEFRRAISQNKEYGKFIRLLNSFIFNLDNSKGMIDYSCFFHNTFYLSYLSKRASLYMISYNKWIELETVKEKDELVDRFCKELYELTTRFYNVVKDNK